MDSNSNANANAEEAHAMRVDLQAHPEQSYFLEFNNIPCKVTRNNSIYPHMGPDAFHWCGYVLQPSASLQSKIDSGLIHVYGGWTYEDAEGVIGFDCAHVGDFPISQTGTFKTYEFVVAELERACRE
jgi:hypothetical protein